MTPYLTDAVMKGVKVRGKTALRWECELMYNQNYVNVMGSQLFRASGNTETDFSNLIYIAFITAWQSCMSVLVGSRPYRCRHPNAYLDR